MHKTYALSERRESMAPDCIHSKDTASVCGRSKGNINLNAHEQIHTEYQIHIIIAL